MRATEAEALAIQARLNRGRRGRGLDNAENLLQPKQAQKRATVRRGVMNKLETAFFNEVLQPRKLVGEFDYVEFEPFTFRMANNAKYTPDFMTRSVADNKLTIWETKGHWRDAAKLRIKWAAQKFPMFKFVAVRRKDGQWAYESF